MDDGAINYDIITGASLTVYEEQGEGRIILKLSNSDDDNAQLEMDLPGAVKLVKALIYLVEEYRKTKS